MTLSARIMQSVDSAFGGSALARDTAAIALLTIAFICGLLFVGSLFRRTGGQT